MVLYYRILMKSTILGFCGLLTVASILGGCGESKPAAPAAEPKPTASPPTDTSAATPATAPPPAAPAAAAAANAAQATPPAAAPVEAAKAADTDATSQFVAASKAQGDSVASAIGSDLVDKVKTLTQSAAGNDTLKSQLNSSMQSLAGGNDAGGLATLYQAAQGASLTPSQLQLAKDAGNLASAYVVQRNFATLPGSQSDVATIVNSLRQGQITPAIPAFQKVAQNASLTPAQKQLVASIADKYAPGVTKAASALQQGLQSVPGLGGSGK
jgi:hypothetical protein